MNAINLSEVSKRAIQSFTQRRKQYLQKIQHTAQLEQQARELESKIDELSEALRRARSDYSEAKNNYIKSADMAAVNRTLQKVQDLERELQLAQSVLPLADNAWKDSNSRDALFIPQPPYAEIADDILSGLPDELGFALWCFTRAHGRLRSDSGRWLALFDRLTKDGTRYEAQFKALIDAA